MYICIYVVTKRIDFLILETILTKEIKNENEIFAHRPFHPIITLDVQSNFANV